MFHWLISLFVIYLGYKVYKKLRRKACCLDERLVGKVVIVTGGGSGIGLETAKTLANCGARVIITCRNVRRAAAAVHQIVGFSGNKDVHLRHLDLSSFKSVRKFCDSILKTESRLDVLINNAGALALGNYKTEDGVHVGMQVNYFGPFLLTCLLLPILRSSAPSRIINLSSGIHKYGLVDFDNMNMDKYWSDYLAYANSKLYLNLMTLELSRRLKGTGVTVNALHPGAAPISLPKDIPYHAIRNILYNCATFLFPSAVEASQTSVYLAMSPDVEGVSGRYFKDCQETKPSKLAQDPKLAERLWIESERIVKFCLSDGLS